MLQSTKFEFVLNLTTAKALGIEVPSGVLSIIDEAIESCPAWALSRTGRAIQPGFEQMEGGLALLYPALAWSDCAPGHHGYPRAPDLILGEALKASATRSRM